MARKRKAKAVQEAPPYDADPQDGTSNDVNPEPPPAPGAGSWIILAIHKTRTGDSHRILSRDWKVLPPDSANTSGAMRFETQEDANAFISGELIAYGVGRPLCFYRFAALDMSS